MKKRNKTMPFIVAGILVVITLVFVIWGIAAGFSTDENIAGADATLQAEELVSVDSSASDESVNEASNDVSSTDDPGEEKVEAADSTANEEKTEAVGAEEETTVEADTEKEASVNSDVADAGDTEESAASETASTEAQPVATPQTGGHLIVIDPGHQSKGMSEKEPNGPGSTTMKAKVTGGTTGKTSGLTEYQLNLTVGLKLRDELQNRGYTVIMTRESNDVSLSNVDRAQIANNAGAEAFVRIHANGSDNTATNGAMTICQTASNPYNAAYYPASRKLSDCVLDAFVASTGCKKQYVWETDTMTGINWANVPSTIIEMGYMSNPTEDTNMASEDYQRLMVLGIANGIDNYFNN